MSTSIPPLAIGVCSWSLQVTSVPELDHFMKNLGVQYTQIACGDPQHASWSEGDEMPTAARTAGFQMSGAMLGFPGEDYTSPQTIMETGGFGPVALRSVRLDRLKWALERTLSLGLSDLMLHAGFLPEPGSADRTPFLNTLELAAELAAAHQVTLAFETGQESALLLRRTLDDLQQPNIKVNFDPANMLLYDMGDPIEAIQILGPDIQSVHMKDARRPKTKGEWGEEVPLGQGEVDIPRFLQTLQKVGFAGPLMIEREVGDQAARFRDIAQGIALVRQTLASPCEPH